MRFVNTSYSSPQEPDPLWMSSQSYAFQSEIWGDSHNNHKDLIKHLGSSTHSYYICYQRLRQRADENGRKERQNVLDPGWNWPTEGSGLDFYIQVIICVLRMQKS